jgi:ferredoxin-NADP reductase
MEWTLPHTQTDARGARRWFTLASSPTEPDLRLGVKFSEGGSSYKMAMRNMDNESVIVAAQVAGDFVMPRDQSRKLVFIAGGIGITPFRSMIKYLLDSDEQRPVRILYSARTENDFAYRDVLEAARHQLAINTEYLVTDRGATISHAHTASGAVNADLIRQSVPDYRECIFYISGTHDMVADVQQQLHGLGVHKRHVKTDFFPGYA